MNRVDAIFQQAIHHLAFDPIDHDALADAQDTATANAADAWRKEQI